MALEPLPPEVSARTIPALLEQARREAPDRVALVAGHHVHGELALTYAELADRAARLAAVLAERGVGPGDRVGILLDADAAADAHVAYHAAHHLGAIAVPLNSRYVARELRYVLEFARPAALVFGAPFAEALEQLRASIEGTRLLEAAADPALGEPLEDLVEAAAPVPAADIDETEVADWIFTSGTTGHPRAVALSHANSVACGIQAVPLWGLDASSVYQSAAPFFTSTACHTNLLSCLTARCTYVVEPAFDARETLRRVERHGTTSVFWISSMLAIMLDRVPEDELLGAYDLSSLRRLVYGGQLMNRPFYERVADVFGHRLGVDLVHVYGLTEGGTSGTFLRPEQHADAVARVGEHGISIGTAGFHPWVRLRVADEEDRQVGPGVVGELCLAGPSVMEGYVADEASTREALRGGWLHTGDMVMRDDAGFLYFVDRAKQMIRRGGLDISSTEVEAVVLTHPAVAEAAAIGRPNPILGEDVAAVVVLREGAQADARELIEHCAEHLADYKVPREIRFVDALPRNAMGRVVKPELRATLAASS
jgi:acyl-CoA synthetase (AMP-forming)/AMP-acid ligase II